MTEVPRPAGLQDEDQKRALLDAAQAAVADARERAKASRAPSRSRVGRTLVAATAMVLFGAGTYLLATRPAWFFTPPPPPPSPEVQEASIRLTLVREATRIQQFRITTGRLPDSLAQTGSPVTGISYERQGDTVFVLRAPFGTERIALASTDSTSAFLGRSVQVITMRARP